MARPFRTRAVGPPPAVTVFKPAGLPASALEWVHMALDEYEAIQLVDGARLDQEAAAARMGVSRPTVTRILARARAKVARMLTEGAALAIEGGPVVQVAPGWRRGRRWGWPEPGFGRAGAGPGGRGRGRGRRRGIGRGAQAGPADVCMCPQCGNQVAHSPGTPCATMRCGACGATMVRGT